MPARGQSTPAIIRLARRCVPNPVTGCVEFVGGRSSQGKYAYIEHEGHIVPIHRVVYEHHKGPIPAGKSVHHSCLNRVCVAPDHLAIADHATHMKIHAAHRAAIRAARDFKIQTPALAGVAA